MKNNFYKLITFSLLFAGANLTSMAQLKNCGTTEATQKLYDKFPELVAQDEAFNNAINEIIKNKTPEERASTTVYTIPIVFHIIHQNGAENIPDTNIFNQVAILNRDYRKLNSDTATVVNAFKPLIADSYVEFALPTIDPNGNCTNGIDRIYSHKTNSADDYSKLNGWPRDKYLNVWVVKSIGDAGVAGYAYYPAAVSGPLYPVDGVLILYNYIGALAPSNANQSRALTHEIGHYLNLQHPWGNNNDPNVACGDDQVNDTPPTKGHINCTTADKYAPACTILPIGANYLFDNVTTTSGTTDPTPAPVVDSVTLSSFTANGVGANSSTAGVFSFDGWDTGAADGATVYSSLTGAVNTSKYYEFTITPPVENSMTITGLTFLINRSATGPRTWAIRTGTFSSNLGTASISPANTNLSVQSGNVFFLKYDSTQVQKGTKVTISGASFLNALTPMTFRIYPYNAEDAFGTFGIDSVYLTGTNGTIENTENYMDYSYCSKMYTFGQRDRLRTALESPVSQRNNLWSASNLNATGVTSPQVCLPYPDFFSNRQRICAGNSITYTKNISNASVYVYNWQFEGGTPSSYTGAGPFTVTYNTPGLYKTSLTATSPAGTDSVVKTSYIRVDNTWADIDFTGAYVEDFENTSNFYWDWQVRNYDDNANTWSVSNLASYNNSGHSVVMGAFQNYANDVDDLTSPSYDLSYITSPYMTFQCAAASSGGTAADVNDVLKVWASINCGQTWSLRATFKDSTLINNGYQATYFVPGSASVWTERTVPLTGSFATDNVTFKFEYTSGNASNNIYIDYINLHGAVGIDENGMADANLTIYPNPTNQSSTIAYHLNKKADTKVEVVDVLGKAVYSQVNNGQTEGDYKVTVSKQNQNLTNGIYFVKFTIGSETITRKLIITQ